MVRPHRGPRAKPREIAGDERSRHLRDRLRADQRQPAILRQRADAVQPGPERRGRLAALPFFRGREERRQRVLYEAHEALDLSEIPFRKLRSGRQPVVEYGRPGGGVRLEKGEVAAQHAVEIRLRVSGEPPFRYGRVQGVQRRRVDVQDELVETVEQIVQRAGRIADRPGDAARRQAAQAVLLHEGARRRHRHGVELLAAMIRSSCHAQGHQFVSSGGRAT